MVIELTGPRHLWREMRKELFLMLLISCLAYYFHHHVYSFELDIPEGALGIFGLAITVFIIFRTNKVYERWWEARIIWGQIVNDSRTWAMKVMALINADTAYEGISDQQVSKVQKELIHRHLAFINALRMHLRRQEDWDELAEYLAPEELATTTANHQQTRPNWSTNKRNAWKNFLPKAWNQAATKSSCWTCCAHSTTTRANANASKIHPSPSTTPS